MTRMIIGTHIVVASKDPDADHAVFRDIFGLSSVDAGGGYTIFRLPDSEASVHPSDGAVPHHELYFMADDINAFVEKVRSRGLECEGVQDTGWGLLVKVTLPSGAPIHVYQPKHERPA